MYEHHGGIVQWLDAHRGGDPEGFPHLAIRPDMPFGMTWHNLLDTVESSDGTIEIGESDHGGALVTVRLPPIGKSVDLSVSSGGEGDSTNGQSNVNV